jgi:hypothetical protein
MMKKVSWNFVNDTRAKGAVTLCVVGYNYDCVALLPKAHGGFLETRYSLFQAAVIEKLLRTFRGRGSVEK